MRITQGGGQSASLTRHLSWGLAVLAVVLAVLRFWPVSSRLPAVPATGAAHFAAASIDSTPDGRTSDDTYSPPAIPMPPPLSPHILIVHARDYPLYPVITGGDPTDGTLPVPPVRAVVRVDMPAFHTFTHPPSVPITAPSGR